MKSILISVSIVLSLNVFSAHHESSESGLMPVAKPGQVVVTYRGECPAEKIDKAINIVKKIGETKRCDIFVILTEWEEFKLIDVEESKIIFDGRNINQNKNKISIGK